MSVAKDRAIGWISPVTALAALSLSLVIFVKDTNRLGADSAVALASTLTKIESDVGYTKKAMEKLSKQIVDHESETKIFEQCANRNFDAITMSGKPQYDCTPAAPPRREPLRILGDDG